MERTLAIIKPDATERRIAGKIISRIEDEGFRILGMRMVSMTLAQAEGFYAVHRERPFFGDLTSFMSSGKTVVLALERRGQEVEISGAWSNGKVMGIRYDKDTGVILGGASPRGSVAYAVGW